MTDDDRQLLLELRRMTDACGAFCAGVIEDDLSRDDQLALGEWLVEMGERIRRRGLRTPVVIEGECGRQMTPSSAGSPEGYELEQVGQTGGTVAPFAETSEAEAV